MGEMQYYITKEIIHHKFRCRFVKLVGMGWWKPFIGLFYYLHHCRRSHNVRGGIQGHRAVGVVGLDTSRVEGLTQIRSPQWCKDFIWIGVDGICLLTSDLIYINIYLICQMLFNWSNKIVENRTWEFWAPPHVQPSCAFDGRYKRWSYQGGDPRMETCLLTFCIMYLGEEKFD